MGGRLSVSPVIQRNIFPFLVLTHLLATTRCDDVWVVDGRWGRLLWLDRWIELINE